MAMGNNMTVLKQIYKRLEFSSKFLFCISLIVFLSSLQSKGKLPFYNLVGASKNDSISIVNGVFDIPELNIISSPNKALQIIFPVMEKVIDYDVSPEGITVAAIVKEIDEKYFIKFWKIDKTEIPLSGSKNLGISISISFN